MTERLYYTDAYLAEFDATVTGVADEGRRIYLDHSAFYPTSGGQPNDLGTISGVQVADVVDEDERVAHVLAAPLIGATVGGSVRGAVDSARRFDHMQQHTGQHLLSAVFAERFGLATVSVHFGATSATLDLDAESLSAERLREAEAMANTIATENRAVTVAFEDAATATGLRKPSDRGGVLRIVSIDGLDRSACGGTHVRSTGEIGPILLRRTERVRRTTRVEFVCGLRAVRRARADYEALFAMATQLSASIDEVPPLVGAQQEQLREAVAERNRLDGEVQAGRARALYEASAPNADGVRVHVERTPMAPDTLRALAQAFVSNPRALFVSVAGEPPTLLVAASEDSGLDAGAELRRALAAVGGKGGGSARLAQGRLPSAETIDAALTALNATRR